VNETGGPQFAVDVVQLVLVGRDDVQLDRGVFAVGALALIHAVMVDRRVFLDDLDDLVLVATLGNSILGAFTSVSVMA
jgi:hypothetical protein